MFNSFNEQNTFSKETTRAARCSGVRRIDGSAERGRAQVRGDLPCAWSACGRLRSGWVDYVRISFMGAIAIVLPADRAQVQNLNHCRTECHSVPRINTLPADRAQVQNSNHWRTECHSVPRINTLPADRAQAQSLHWVSDGKPGSLKQEG